MADGKMAIMMMWFQFSFPLLGLHRTTPPPFSARRNDPFTVHRSHALTLANGRLCCGPSLRVCVCVRQCGFAAQTKPISRKRNRLERLERKDSILSSSNKTQAHTARTNGKGNTMPGHRLPPPFVENQSLLNDGTRQPTSSKTPGPIWS